MTFLLAPSGTRPSPSGMRRWWSVAIATFLVGAAVVYGGSPGPEYRAAVLVAASDAQATPEQIGRLGPGLLATNSLLAQVSTSLGTSLSEAALLVERNVTIELIPRTAAVRVVAQTPDPHRAADLADSVGRAMDRDLSRLGTGEFLVWPADVHPVHRPGPISATSILAAGIAFTATRFGLANWPRSATAARGSVG